MARRRKPEVGEGKAFKVVALDQIPEKGLEISSN